MSETETIKDDTILAVIRDGLGYLDHSFDKDLITYINTGTYDLYQVGVITTPVIDQTTKWKDIIVNSKDIPTATSYLALSTKLLFDSPQPSIVATYNSTLSRMLSRLHLERYRKDEEVEDIGK